MMVGERRAFTRKVLPLLELQTGLAPVLEAVHSEAPIMTCLGRSLLRGGVIGTPRGRAIGGH